MKSLFLIMALACGLQAQSLSTPLQISPAAFPVGITNQVYFVAFSAANPGFSTAAWTFTGLPPGLHPQGRYVFGIVTSVVNGVPIQISATANGVTLSTLLYLAICNPIGITPSKATVKQGESVQFYITGGAIPDSDPPACNLGALIEGPAVSPPATAQRRKKQ